LILLIKIFWFKSTFHFIYQLLYISTTLYISFFKRVLKIRSINLVVIITLLQLRIIQLILVQLRLIQLWVTQLWLVWLVHHVFFILIIKNMIMQI